MGFSERSTLTQAPDCSRVDWTELNSGGFTKIVIISGLVAI